MSDTEVRPEPLRVPVVDVARRSSLVGATRSPGPPVSVTGSVVLQRAVRIVSDRPAPRASDGSTAVEARKSTKSVPPPALTNGAVSGRQRSPEVAAGASEAILEPSLESPKEGDVATQGAAFVAIGLSEDRRTGSPDDTAPDDLSEEEELDASSLEVSVPPPAPAEALRRSPPSNDVEITVSYDDDDDENPSGEFDALEVDGETRDPARDPSRTPPPPPVVVGRGSSMGEPPDLQTLTRTARVAEARPSKPRAHPWWEVFFDDDYLRTVRQPTHEQISRQCDFLAKRLSLSPGATVLDVGCGLGLQVVEFGARGYRSVGLDLSLAMLSRASEEAQARGTKINFLHADMRDMNFEGNFDAVMCIGTSLGYFDDDTNKKVIERMFRALKPNGVLLLDVVNRDHVIRTQPNLIWFEGDGCVCMEESDFNYFTSRLHVKRTVILEQGKQRENEYSLRLYSLHELGQMLHQNGFRVVEVSGREALPGVFFGQESPNLMVVAERRTRPEGTGKYPALPE